MGEQNLALIVSDRIYQVLLFAYPAPFRHEYGSHMAQVFRDECRDAMHQTGRFGVFLVWLALAPDLLRSALAEHLWEVWHMPIEKFLRGSGLAAMVAGTLWILLFALSLRRLDWDASPAILTAVIWIVIMLLFALSLVGLQRYYSSQLFVRLSFGLAYVSIAWLIVGGLMALLTEWGWYLFISGFFLFAFGLALIGLAGLVTKSLSPWGILLALTAVSLVGFVITGDDPSPPIQTLLGTAYGLEWIIIGFMLWRRDLATPDSALPA